jgi:serine/threonine-protein kinase
VAGLVAYSLTRPERVTVPNVTNLTADTAVARLESEGLDAEIKPVPNEKARDTVLEQFPLAGERVDEGTTVELSVSSGPAIVKVPTVTNLSEEDATARLEEAGLEVAPELRFSDQVPKDRAIGTEPGPGTEVPTGSAVTLLISKGTNQVAVPFVVGLQTDEALAKLNDLELSVNVVQRDDDAPQGEVVDQSPEAGELVKKGAQVTIFASTGIVQVPSVVGLPRQEAVTELKAAGFRVAIREDTTAAPEEDGLVIDQFPPQGSRTQRGDTITIVVGAPPAELAP